MLKKLIRSLASYALAIYLVSQVVPGFKVNTDLRGLILAGLCLSLLFTFVYPLLKFLFLPLNFVTLGLFSTIAQILTFYIFLTILPDYFHVSSWRFEGWALPGLGLRVLPFTVTPFLTIILSTFLVSLIVSAFAFLL